MNKIIAHCGNNGEPHDLKEHLLCTALQAAKIGKKFGLEQQLYLIGLIHDLGKAADGFQKYITAACKDEKVDNFPHAVWGSALVYLLAKEKINGADDAKWLSVFAPIYSHHAGLKIPGYLYQKLNEYCDHQNISQLEELRSYLIKNNFHKALYVLNTPDVITAHLSMKIRMILSALVDADHSDTGSFYLGFSDLPRTIRAQHWEWFEQNQQKLLSTKTNISKIRKEIYESCINNAEGEKGFYRLTVPTGGGKTRSGLGFALKHALKHKMDRIIVVIPYTSIIDQNAKVYREIYKTLDNEAVLEHHSQVAIPDEQELNEDQRKTEAALRRATQNWNAPIVVTTTVQFFESLFSDRPSNLRKLHNIANSIIILDEAQALPLHLLKPIEKSLKSLMEEYGCTVVFSTATQPAMEVRQLGEFKTLDRGEIVPAFSKHFEQLKRVTYTIRTDFATWDEIAEEIKGEKRVLVILNTRKDAITLFQILQEKLGDKCDYLRHLSTLLCPAHRREILADVYKKITSDEPILLISTQVVEAGVDLDFPKVYRAMGPMDRIIQAAGRCNRNMELEGKGEVVIFSAPDGRTPGGPYAKGMATTETMLLRADSEQLHDPNFQKRYFEDLFRDMGDELDKKEILSLEEKLRFPDVAQQFKMIEQNTVPVVVPYGNSRELLKKFIYAPSQDTWRQLQLYTVNVYRHQLYEFTMAKPVIGDLYEWTGVYDTHLGMKEGLYDPADLITSV